MDTTLSPKTKPAEPETLELDVRRPPVTISVPPAAAAHLAGWLTEKRLIAAHEAAHCAIACVVEPKIGVASVSITGQHAGWTETDENDDRKPLFRSERQLWSSLLVTLAGWAMERRLLGQVTTGCEGDLRRATEIALSRCAAGMEPDEMFISLEPFDYDTTPPFLRETLARSVMRQLAEARLEVEALVAEHRDRILALAETIYDARRLSDRALESALEAAGFKPARLGEPA